MKFSMADSDAGGSLFNDLLTFGFHAGRAVVQSNSCSAYRPVHILLNFDTNTSICIITVAMITSNYQSTQKSSGKMSVISHFKTNRFFPCEKNVVLGMVSEGISMHPSYLL